MLLEGFKYNLFGRDIVGGIESFFFYFSKYLLCIKYFVRLGVGDGNKGLVFVLRLFII